MTSILVLMSYVNQSFFNIYIYIYIYVTTISNERRQEGYQSMDW